MTPKNVNIIYVSVNQLTRGTGKGLSALLAWKVKEEESLSRALRFSSVQPSVMCDMRHWEGIPELMKLKLGFNRRRAEEWNSRPPEDRFQINFVVEYFNLII